jgi:hypothetical protein
MPQYESMPPCTPAQLNSLYLLEKKSARTIAIELKCSETKIHYWLKKYNIPKRTISDAVYVKWNPNGDPFAKVKPKTIAERILYGIGIGLYWGEGTKSDKYSVRLGNSDPRLVRKFIEFLEICFKIDRKKLRFGLQIFSDLQPQEVLKYWHQELDVSSKQFYQLIITPSTRKGTYRNKAKYGVLTIYYNNKKLRNILCQAIDDV